MSVSPMKTGGCCMKPWMQNVFSTYTGSSSIEGFFRRMPSVISVNNYNYSGLYGYGYGSGYINGGWNNGLMTFSDIIADRDKTTWWSCFSAGIKEQLYLNPFGTAGTGIMVAGAGLGILGNLANALANFGQNQGQA